MLFDFESFQSRHIGPDAEETAAMLKAVGAPSLDALMDEAIPARIRLKAPMNLPAGQPEHQFLKELRAIGARNRIARSFIGYGYCRLHYAERDPPQCAGESGLVHARTRRIRPRSRRAASNRSSISRRW